MATDMNANYTEQTTSIDVLTARDYMETHGYETTQYNNITLNNVPFPLWAIGEDSSSGLWHAWVIDRYETSIYTSYDKYEKDDGYDIWRIYIETGGQSHSRVHCNWGL